VAVVVFALISTSASTAFGAPPPPDAASYQATGAFFLSLVTPQRRVGFATTTTTNDPVFLRWCCASTPDVFVAFKTSEALFLDITSHWWHVFSPFQSQKLFNYHKYSHTTHIHTCTQPYTNTHTQRSSCRRLCCLQIVFFMLLTSHHIGNASALIDVVAVVVDVVVVLLFTHIHTCTQHTHTHACVQHGAERALSWEC
jgi:hypothetical protein